MDEDNLLRLWGKTKKGSNTLYHPLLFHLMDVGNVALLLWRECLPGALRQRITRALGLTDKEEAGRVVALVAGLHDIGKACPPFQHQEGVDRLSAAVAALGLNPTQERPKPHNVVSAKVLPGLLETDHAPLTAISSVARLLADITGAHHGTFASSTELCLIAGGTLGDANWSAAREALAECLAQSLDESGIAFSGPLANEIVDPGVVPLLAGLIAVADWFGSSKKHFPAETDVNEAPPQIADYACQSCERARTVLREVGWLRGETEPTRLSPLPLGAMFGFPKKGITPNRMQETVERLAAETAGGPYLLIIEAAMGTGKTEAALYAFDRSLCAQTSSGLYVALPTQATSNALFTRLQTDYLKHLAERGVKGRLNTQLVHGNALLSEEMEQLRIEATENGPDDAEDGRIVAEGWFAQDKKQALLAPFGVGTIDQSLLGVLQTRHWFVRLFALAGKTVVFDEVHAYDVYMSAVLKRLIRWLAELGCTVILLSATLPSARRVELITAYREGSDAPTPKAPAEPYPRVTLVDRMGHAYAEHVGEPNEVPKTVHLSVLPPEDVSALAKRIQADLPGGGCAAIICNTVDRAQDVYRTLEEALPDWDRLLFHARTPFAWRDTREKQVLAKFGKESLTNGERPPGTRTVLVATQVVEQSLDLDFDWMASDIAPGDLLLQRLGRLWRHNERTRPRGCTVARFVLLCDADRGGLPPVTFGKANELIYERYVLLRSWLAVRDKDALTLPGDIEKLVEDVYEEGDPRRAKRLPPPDATWEAALYESYRAYDKARRRDANKAESAIIGEPQEPEALVAEFNARLPEDDDPAANSDLFIATRLSRVPSLSVVCLGTASDGTPIGQSPKGSLDMEATRALLHWALPLSGFTLFKALRDQKPPDNWQKNPHLRFRRAITFHRGEATVAGRRLWLREEEGLVIERTVGEEAAG